jgi:hypothetical protein
MNDPDPGKPTQGELLEQLQRDAFSYFVHETTPANGLVRDKSREGWPASIAAVGLALSAYPIAVERGILRRSPWWATRNGRRG